MSGDFKLDLPRNRHSMWDFDDDFDTDLDLGSRRKPVEWVAVAPPLTERTKNHVAKRWV